MLPVAPVAPVLPVAPVAPYIAVETVKRDTISEGEGWGVIWTSEGSGRR